MRSALWCRTIYQLDAPFNNPVEGEPAQVTIVDPTHPLFGRSFPLLHATSSRTPQRAGYLCTGYLFVAYRGYMTLKIPRAATDLAYTPVRLTTKISVASLQDLFSLAQEYDQLCLLNQSSFNPRSSGESSPQPCEDKSSKNSP